MKTAAAKLAEAMKDRKGIEPPNKSPRKRVIGYGSPTGPIIAALKQDLRSARATIKRLEQDLRGANGKLETAAVELGRLHTQLFAGVESVKFFCRRCGNRCRPTGKREHKKKSAPLLEAYQRVAALEAENDNLRKKLEIPCSP